MSLQAIEHNRRWVGVGAPACDLIVEQAHFTSKHVSITAGLRTWGKGEVG